MENETFNDNQFRIAIAIGNLVSENNIFVIVCNKRCLCLII